MDTTQRNYGLDLLRLVLMYMVCMLHTLGHGGVLTACSSGTINYKMYWLLEIIAYCAVDGFAFLSGYTSSDKPRKYEKLVEMWFQAFFYSFVLTVCFRIVGLYNSLSIGAIVSSAFPVSFRYFWYFTDYFILFLAIPILNKYIFSINLSSSKKIFVILFVMFSCVTMIQDAFQMGDGYSAIWLMILYFMGSLAKRFKLFENRSTFFLFIMFCLCIFITWSAKMVGYSKLVSYTSPTVLLCGIIIVVLFSRLKFKGGIIAKVSPLAFGIYLFQMNKFVYKNIINNALVFVSSIPFMKGILFVIGFAFVIFLCGLLVEYIRRTLSFILGVPVLSKKIVQLVKQLLNKIVILLN